MRWTRARSQGWYTSPEVGGVIRRWSGSRRGPTRKGSVFSKPPPGPMRHLTFPREVPGVLSRSLLWFRGIPHWHPKGGWGSCWRPW